MDAHYRHFGGRHTRNISAAMNLLNMIQRLFCNHGLQKIVKSEYELNKSLVLMRTDTYECMGCGKHTEATTEVPNENYRHNDIDVMIDF